MLRKPSFMQYVLPTRHAEPVGGSLDAGVGGGDVGSAANIALRQGRIYRWVEIFEVTRRFEHLDVPATRNTNRPP